MMNIGRVINAGNSGAEEGDDEFVGVGLIIWVALGVGALVDVGVAVEETPVKVTTIVASLQGTLVPTLSEGLTRKLPPAMLICEVPVPITTKVIVARTPEEPTDVVSAAKASDNPSRRLPLVLSHDNCESHKKKVGFLLLSERKGPSLTVVKFKTSGFQLTVDTVQPQIPCAFVILRSMLTSVPIGFGLGPKVMLEVLVVPDCTALITAVETFAASAIDEIFRAPDAEIKDNKISPLNAVKINFFLTVISWPSSKLNQDA